MAKFTKLQGTQRKFQNDQYKRVKYITVKGMGKTIEKTLKLAMHFQQLGYKVDIITGSVQVLDEFEKKVLAPAGIDNEDLRMGIEEEEEDDDDERNSLTDYETEYKKRMVSSVEARVWLQRE